MELIHHVLPKDHEIGFAACFHFGNPHQHESGIKNYIDWVKAKENRYAFLVGDIAEAINKYDKRHEDGKHKKLIIEQYNDSVDAFRPIKQRILGANFGNHDYATFANGDFVKEVFCRQLKIPYGSFSSKIIVKDESKRLQYKVFTTHGNGGVRSQHADPIMRVAAEQSQVKRKLSGERMADCILQVIAHFHKAIVVPPFQDLYLVDNGSRIKQKYIAEADPRASFIPVDLRWHIAVPGFVKKYGDGSGYVERSGYPPVELGFISVKVEDYKIVSAQKILV